MTKKRGRGFRPARTARVAAALAVLAAAAYGFFAAGLSGDLPSRLVPAWQLFPFAARVAVLSAGTAGLAAGAGYLAALTGTAVFGRWYCAALCPLGTLQDLASLARGKSRRYREALPGLRAAALIGALGLALAGMTAAASWIDPWSIFGRFISYDVQPAARLALRADTPDLGAGFAAAAGLAMAAILIASAFHGRWFCGSLCPVGTVLGLLNRIAFFRLRLDEAACISCGRCASVCRASCADGEHKRIDAARCVYCLACAEVCPTGAISYGRAAPSAPPAPADGQAALGSMQMSRGRFIAALGAGAVVLTAAAASRQSPARSILRALPGVGGGAPLPVTPPGSRAIDLFIERCTACGLCVARCPAKILRPSFGELGAAGLLTPRLDYNVSYCQYDCTACLDVCPSGALEKLSLERKKLTKIGDSTLIRNLCVVVKNGTRCGACAEHCPTGAVRMVVGATGLPEPVFDSSICIGCGACHHACPVEPDKAITVAGLAEHRTAETPSKTLFDATPAGPGEPGPTVHGESAKNGTPTPTEEFPF